MVVSTAGRPGVWMISRFAYAAGVTGTLANLLLIAFFAKTLETFSAHRRPTCARLL